MKRFNRVVLSIVLMGPSLLMGSVPAYSDPFVERNQRFNDHDNDFMQSLENASSQMQSDRAYTDLHYAKRMQAEQQSIQDGTGAVSRQAFEAAQMQAAQSGGLYNGGGNYGSNGIGGPYGFGAFGIGNPGIGNSWMGQIAPGTNTDPASGTNNFSAFPTELKKSNQSTANAPFYTTADGKNRIIRQPNKDPFSNFSGGSFSLPQ